MMNPRQKLFSSVRSNFTSCPKPDRTGRLQSSTSSDRNRFDQEAPNSRCDCRPLGSEDFWIFPVDQKDVDGYRGATATSIRSGSDVSMSADSDTSGYGSALDFTDRNDVENEVEPDTLSADEAFIDDFYRGAEGAEEFYDLDDVIDFHSKPLEDLLAKQFGPTASSPAKAIRTELSSAADGLLALIDDLKLDKKFGRKIQEIPPPQVDNIYEEIQECCDGPSVQPQLTPPPLPLRPSRFVKSASVRFSDDRMSLGQKIRSRLTQSVRFGRMRNLSIGRTNKLTTSTPTNSPRRSQSVETLVRSRLRPKQS